MKSMNFGYLLSFKTIDKGFIEQFGPTGFSSLISNLAFNFVVLQTGYVYHTIYIFSYSFIALFIYYLLLSFEITLSFFNIQFFLLFFCYYIFCLSKTS